MAAPQTDETIAKLRELTGDQRIVMLTTDERSIGGGSTRLGSRPLTVLDTDDGGTTWFLVSRSADWIRGLDAGERAMFTGSNDDDGSWFAVSGTVAPVEDRARIRALWTPVAGAWFEGADDPDLVALRFDADELSWWDSPSSGLVRLYKMAKAALGGDRDDVGDHATEPIR
jgi:general stress protein 26